MREMGLKARDLQRVCSNAEVVHSSDRVGAPDPMFNYVGEDVVVVLADKAQGPTVVTVLPRTTEVYVRS